MRMYWCRRRKTARFVISQLAHLRWPLQRHPSTVLGPLKDPELCKVCIHGSCLCAGQASKLVVKVDASEHLDRHRIHCAAAETALDIARPRQLAHWACIRLLGTRTLGLYLSPCTQVSERKWSEAPRPSRECHTHSRSGTSYVRRTRQ